MIERAECQSTEFIIKGHLGSSVRFSVIKETDDEGNIEHFLQAQALGTELDLICSVRFRFSPFVFDGNHSAVPVELNHITLTAEP